MKSFVHAALIITPLAFVGCGSSTPTGPSTVDVNEQNKVTSKDELKKRLTEIANTGVAGSATAGLEPGINDLRAGNAKLADELAADLKKLQATQSPVEIKKIAAAMAAKL